MVSMGLLIVCGGAIGIAIIGYALLYLLAIFLQIGRDVVAAFSDYVAAGDWMTIIMWLVITGAAVGYVGVALTRESTNSEEVDTDG
jgi:hypothetical protein